MVSALLAGGLYAGEPAIRRIHVWEMQEITFHSAKQYDNPYVDVQIWIELQGPDFAKRVYGFWDGGAVFKARFVATAPGDWGPLEDSTGGTEFELAAGDTKGLAKRIRIRAKWLMVVAKSENAAFSTEYSIDLRMYRKRPR